MRQILCTVAYAVALVLGGASAAGSAVEPASAPASVSSGSSGSHIQFDDTSIDVSGVDDRR